jgi:subtilisin family serine protease
MTHRKSIPPKIDWQFIVVLKDGVDPHEYASERMIDPLEVYTGILNGFAAHIARDRVLEMHDDPRVISIERDGFVEGECFTRRPSDGTHTQRLDPNGDPWGLDRIDQLSTRYTGTYTYRRTGKGVTVYILDTGIDYGHREFEGRAVQGYDAFGGNGRDRDGHGTHVAGTVGGKFYGVAKEVRLVSVKVLGDDGSGTWSGILAGMDWIIKNAPPQSVACMSLGGPRNLTINAAIAKLVAAGVTVVVAAGNEATLASNVSPASAAEAITVGASTRQDYVADFSNYGPAVDIHAPGLHIVSATPGGRTDNWSGTSMAAPHVAGVAALLLETDPTLWPDGVRAWLLERAHQNRLVRVPPDTPPFLLYKDRL